MRYPLETWAMINLKAYHDAGMWWESVKSYTTICFVWIGRKVHSWRKSLIVWGRALCITEIASTESKRLTPPYHSYLHWCATVSISFLGLQIWITDMCAKRASRCLTINKIMTDDICQKSPSKWRETKYDVWIWYDSITSVYAAIE